MTDAPRQGSECPECRAPVEADWSVCAECGAHLPGAPHHGTGMVREATMPSDDIGDTTFVPLVSGAKRPITIVEAASRPSFGPSVTLDSIVSRGSPENRPPTQPPTEDNQRRITISTSPKAEAEAPVAPKPAETTNAPTPEAREMQKAAEPAVESLSTSTNLSPTVVVVQPEPAPAMKISRDDFAEFQLLIDEAVRRALKEFIAAQTQQAATTAYMTSTRKAESRAAAVGVGLLLGGAVADVVVLNWDTWITGNLYNSVGWLQQTGLIGTAALAGAGAAALAMVVRGRARARRHKALATR